MSTSKPSPLDTAIALVLLAAGQSNRFGSDKLSQPLGGATVAAWSLAAAERAGFATKVMVVSPGRAPYADALTGWRVATNPDAGEGIASSIRAGIGAVPQATRLVFALADMPLVEPAHLRALALAPAVAFTDYSGGRAGVPAGFPASAFPLLLGLEGDRGAASLLPMLDRHKLIRTDPGSLVDVDTPAALARASELLELRAREQRQQCKAR